MAPRPANPPPDRRQEILDAALGIFSAKGYHATTNADIARAAGVTPAALYYYFESKEELFQAALGERRLQIRPIFERISHVADDPERTLSEVIREAAAFFSEERTQSVLRIVLAEGPRDPAVRRIWSEQIFSMVVDLLPYLREQMAAGRIRTMDPRLLFMTLQGPVVATVILRDLLRLPLLQDVTDDALVAHLTRTTLPGLIARPPEE